MNPLVNFINQRFFPLLNEAHVEIEGLRNRLGQNEQEIGQLRIENDRQQEELIEVRQRLAGHDGEPIADVAQRILASLAQRQARIEELEQNNGQLHHQIAEMGRRNRLSFIIGAGAAASSTGTAFIVYKVARFALGFKAGALAGGQMGATIGSAGGPVVILSSTILGSAVGGITGGVCSALI
jgi:transposase